MSNAGKHAQGVNRLVCVDNYVALDVEFEFDGSHHLPQPPTVVKLFGNTRVCESAAVKPNAHAGPVRAMCRYLQLLGV